MSDALQPGKTFRSRFQVRKRLGEGGTAVVYLLHDLHLGRPVCLKKARPKGAYTLATLAAVFAREAKILQLLGGSISPTFYEFREADLELYMEYCPGQSLAEFLEQRRARGQPLKQIQALQLLGRLARAVTHCHARGVIVADLKPTNVLLLTGKKLADEDALYLFDFGGGRVRGEPAGPDSAHYSAGYGALELLQGEAPSFASDVYSLGAILFALLAWREPAYAELPREFGERAAHTDPRLRELTARMTAAGPRERPAPADVSAQLAELEHLLAHPPAEQVTCPDCKEQVAMSSFCKRCGFRLGRGATVALAVPSSPGEAVGQLRRAFADGSWLDVVYWGRRANAQGLLDDRGLALAVAALANLPARAVFPSDLETWLRYGARIDLNDLSAAEGRPFLAAWGKLLTAAKRPLAPYRPWFLTGAEKWPDEDALWLWLAEASPAAEREALLRLGLGQNPQSVELRLALGDLLARVGRPTEALALWAEAIALGRRDLELLGKTYQLAKQCGDGPRGAVLREQILNTDPGSADGFLALAKFARDEGKADEGKAAEALRLADRGLALDPLHGPLQKCKAQLLFDQRKYELVLEHVRDMKLDADVWLLRGVSQFELGQYAEAAGALTEAINAGRHVPIAWIDLVRCYQKMKREETARQVLGQALQVFPQDEGLRRLRDQLR
jgi:tetratricopeptide (TPR) repeat protein